MKYVLFLFLFVICNIACNQQVVKNVSNISKDEKNIVIFSLDSVDYKDTSNHEHSEIVSKQKNPHSIINNDGESSQEMFTLLSASSKVGFLDCQMAIMELNITLNLKYIHLNN